MPKALSFLMIEALLLGVRETVSLTYTEKSMKILNNSRFKNLPKQFLGLSLRMYVAPLVAAY